jgi:hypothetical protein
LRMERNTPQVQIHRVRKRHSTEQHQQQRW